MSNATGQAVYRLRQFFRKDNRPDKYRGTFEIFDDASGRILASCDLAGRAAFADLTIVDQEHRIWRMTPNRKILPSRWTVLDPQQQIAVQFDQKILGKLVNPLYTVVLTLEDGEGNEVYRLVDPRKNIPDRIFGTGPNDWALLRRDQLVARLVRLSRRGEPARGFFGRVRRFLAGSDPGLISAGSEHLLPAPVALGMLLLFAELTDTSAA